MHPLVPALALCLVAALPALADSAKPPNLDPMVLSQPGPVARLMLAQDLFLQGLHARDALALIQSARMMQRVALMPAPEDRLPVHSGKSLKTAAPPPVPFPQAPATLRTAAVLARGDDALLALIDQSTDTEAVPRGAVRQSVAALAPGGSDTWPLAFLAGVTAELAVLGNGQSTLSVVLTDESGQPLCASLAGADRLYCRFAPKANGAFAVTVTNTGAAVEAYRLITN